MINQVIIDQLQAHEGFSSKAYRCTSGRWTLGYGRNIQDKGITEDEARYLLENDINECVADLKTLFAFDRLPEIVQRVLIDMRFALGFYKFRGFKRMIAAIKDEDFALASSEIQDSVWFGEVKSRGITLVAMMLKAA